MRRNPSGFTLVELVMAISITTIIGLAVAGASMALSTAHAHSESRYGSIETARSAMRRIQSSLRAAALVTYVHSNGHKLGYWAGDENEDDHHGDGEPEPDEPDDGDEPDPDEG